MVLLLYPTLQAGRAKWPGGASANGAISYSARLCIQGKRSLSIRASNGKAPGGRQRQPQVNILESMSGIPAAS